jgi:hypothetical protein
MSRRASIFVLLLSMLALSWPSGGRASAARAEQELAIGPKGVSTKGVSMRASASAQAKVNVAIQAGHWKTEELPGPLARLRTSTGASGGGRSEAQVTLDIAQRAARILRAKGLSAEVLPATVPTGYEADLFISLHADGASSAQARGYKVSTRWRSEVAALDAVLVQSIESGYARVTGMPQNASITRAMRGYYAYSTYRGEEYRIGAGTSAAILEMGFMTSAADRAVMFNNPDLVARGVVAGVDNFYARRAEARRLQAEAERQAGASAYDRSAVVLSDSANIRAGAGTGTARVAGAEFGDSFPLLERSSSRPPSGGWDPRQGTQLVTGSGWYKIDIPSSDSEAYISRDLVVIQQ